MKPTILVVEAKSGERSFVPALQKAGYAVDLVSTGAAALEASAQHEPDLIVLDASSMRSNGIRICRQLRKALTTTPIIHIQSEGEGVLLAEADLCLQRPFTPRKLLNKIRALLPIDQIKEEIVRYGSISFYRTKRSVEINGRGENQLTPKLACLLEELMRHPNQVVSRRQLMQNVWNTDYIGDTRTLDVHIRWVRELIEADPAIPRFLRTVRGKGYIFHIPPR